MLTEWWTYRPRDFLMFSPRIYWRLFESINEAWWPMAALFGVCALAALVMGFVMVIGATRAQRASVTAAQTWLAGTHRVVQPTVLPLTQLACLMLAAAWALVAFAFLWQRLTPIFWAAEVAVWAMALQALGWLLLASLLPGWEARGCAEPVGAERRRLLIGGVMATAAVLLYPLLAPLAGRPWPQAELFGLAPDPTVMFSLGVLVLLPSPAGAGKRALARAMWLVPIALCVFSSVTLALMGAWQALMPLAAALLALWAHVRRDPARG